MTLDITISYVISYMKLWRDLKKAKVKLQIRLIFEFFKIDKIFHKMFVIHIFNVFSLHLQS